MATNGSFSSLFNLQSKSINFNFGHFWLIFGQNTKAIALLFGQKWLIFITFQSAIKLNQFQVWSFLAHVWAKYQGYSLTFWPKWLIFITFQSAIKINQFQVWSFLAHFWAIYQVYSLTFWPQMAHFHQFSICNQTQSISILVIFGSFLGKIPSLQPYILATNGSFPSVFNLQSNSINFNFGHFWLIYGQTTKAIALLFGHKWLMFISFQSAIKRNQFHFLSFLAHLFGKYQDYSLTFWPKMAQFHHFSICNQNQSISILVIFGSFLGKIPRL